MTLVTAVVTAVVRLSATDRITSVGSAGPSRISPLTLQRCTPTVAVMLTEDQKRAIEMQAAEAIRREWGGLNGVRVRGVIDDVRTKIIEEGWFGKSTTEKLNDTRYLANEPDKIGLGDIYETSAAKLDAAWQAVFGNDRTEADKAVDKSDRDLER